MTLGSLSTGDLSFFMAPISRSDFRLAVAARSSAVFRTVRACAAVATSFLRFRRVAVLPNRTWGILSIKLTEKERCGKKVEDIEAKRRTVLFPSTVSTKLNLKHLSYFLYLLILALKSPYFNPALLIILRLTLVWLAFFQIVPSLSGPSWTKRTRFHYEEEKMIGGGEKGA